MKLRGWSPMESLGGKEKAPTAIRERSTFFRMTEGESPGDSGDSAAPEPNACAGTPSVPTTAVPSTGDASMVSSCSPSSPSLVRSGTGTGDEEGGR